MAERQYPVINKKAFIYMFDQATGAKVEVGQFEEWGFNDVLNTIPYRESGYKTPLHIALDFNFSGFLSKGKINHNLISQLWGNMPDGSVDISNEIGYWIPKKSMIKLVTQFSDNTTEQVTEYHNCTFFNHSEHNVRGIVEESVGFGAESMRKYVQPIVLDRQP